jgi:hypothetical protein
MYGFTLADRAERVHSNNSQPWRAGQSDAGARAIFAPDATSWRESQPHVADLLLCCFVLQLPKALDSFVDSILNTDNFKLSAICSDPS